MSNLRIRLQLMFMALVLCMATASAQEIRYVVQGGAGTKSGADWANAAANIQDAINDLVNNNKTGEVWVKAGDYYPTETTESSNSPYYKSFKIPAGITVRGGFAGDETSRDQRVTVADKNFGAAMGRDAVPTRDLDGEKTKSGVYENKTILHGDIDQSKRAEMKWNPTKQQFDAVFYGNSYHVVWFAMNGFSSDGRANGLAKAAKLEGCVIEGGHAYTRDANSPHPHIGYGGGIYMVANSFVYNCEVRNCDASRNGGGIYMDGGGIVRRTLVHDCQALGLGTDFGFGGGICENGGALNSKSNPIVVAQSVVTNCVGRMGGGMALLADATQGKNKYAIVANSTLVNNNTAQIEAGGVYTNGGGGLASMTITRNKCNGSGITQNGQITGRSGGVYSRDAAYIGNTVIWGNKCDANKDIQYADSRSSLQDTEKTKFYYSALSNADIADWSKSEKMGVLSLDSANTTEVANKGNKGYPLFEKPTPTAGYLATSLTGGFDWKVFSESALHHAGINTADLDYEGLTPAPQGKSYDMQFGEFNSRCTMGAIVSEEPLIGAKIDEVKKEAHFFVDPNYNFAMHHGTEESKIAKGQSWDLPTRFLGNVLEYIKQNAALAPLSGKSIFVHVKEGTVDNTDSYKSGRVRCTSLDIPSNVTLLGSYDKSLTGENLSKRNPVLTPTVISGQLLDDYKYNIAHLINVEKASNVTIDGFKITLANANSTELGNSNQNGAAITLKDCAKDGDEITVHFKNIIVSNCYGDKGTVVYADNSSADFENCIFHNNTTATLDNNGIVYGIKSDLRFDHCNVLRSVGHASYLDADTKNEWKNSMFYGNLDRQQDNTNNAANYAIAAFDGPGAIASKLTGERCMFDLVSRPLYDQSGASIAGYSYTGNGVDLGVGIPAQSTYYKRTESVSSSTIVNNPNGLEYSYTSGWANGYPRMVNPTKNAGYSTEGDVTYYGRATSFEPHNDNPVVNAAGTNGLPHDSWGLDITTIITRDFGGRPDIGAVESHIATSDQIANENGNPDGQMPYGVAYYVRDYAQQGMPQTYTLNSSTGDYTPAADGKGNYVKEGTEYVFLDGASWQYAVSGNANYGISVDVNTPVNTIWQAVNDPNAKNFNGTFKIHNGTNYFRLTVSGNNVTLTTSNETQATVWTVSGITSSSAVDTDLSTSTHTISTTINGTTYYLYSYNSGNKNSRNFTLAKSGSGYTLQYTGTATVYIRYNNGLTYTTRATQATSWVFDPQYTLGGWIEKEVVPSGKSTTDRAPVTGNVINQPLDLHVYSSLTDVNNLGAANVVSYKIKLQGSTMYTYDRANNNRNLGSTNTVATAHNFVLISTGTADQYYIYDLNSNRYVYNNNNTSIRLSATIQSPWSILVDAGNASFNIVRPGTTSAWSNAGNNQNMAYAAPANENQKWVLVPNKNYTNKYYTETHTVGEQLNGLQYAVNTVHDEYISKKTQHQVHVGEGTYTNRTGAASGADAAKNEVSQPYAYMMKEGVDVLGGYPTIGNPGEEQRQPKTFVTILQPSNDNPYVSMEFNKLTTTNTGYSIMNVQTGAGKNGWGAYVKQNNANDAASFARVLVQPVHFNVQTLWDGFTIQNGYLNTAYSQKIENALGNLHPAEVRQSGGAGVLLQDNGIIENCVVKNNVILIAPSQVTGNMIQTGEDSDKTVNSDNIYTFITGGAGVFMSAKMETAGEKKDKAVTGVGGIVRNCEVYENQLISKAVIRYQYTSNNQTFYRPDNIWQFGGGIYQNGGDVFNTIVHDNDAVTLLGTTIANLSSGNDKNNEMMLGAGVFVSQGNFYNNTIVNNRSCTYFQNHDNHCAFGGVHVFEYATIYNSLIADNKSHWSYEHWTSGTNPGNGVPVSAFVDDATDRWSRDKTKVHVKYSFVDVHHGEQVTVSGKTIDVDLVSHNDEIVDERDAETRKIPLNTNIYLDRNPNVTGAVDYSDLTTKVYYPKGNAKEYQLIEITSTGAGSPCINTGTTSIWDPIAKSYVVIPDVDAAYTDRIKDCKIDIGAFESDGAATIHPQQVGDNQLIFYVTPEGYGKTDGSDPANAACAPKLQKVIDAAGRYKIQNRNKQVIVKVANSYDLHDEAGDDFTYYATRTTDQSSTDTRMWSIQIPRGVEVWGGYTDVALNNDGTEYKVDDKRVWDNTYNGFTFNGTDCRSITGNPTYFDSYFYNKDMRINATTYHVVTFTDRIYDVNGVPFLKSDIFDVDGAGKVTGLKAGIDLTTAISTAIGNDETDETRFAHMSDIIGTANVMADKIGGKTVSNRAVLDGIFVTGGNADGKALSGSSNLNANGYGGAAIVTDYAYVRNCIVKNNSATNGGAFALTDRALVSGSLIIENNADNMGGGLYVFENGATLSNGIKVNTTAPDGQQMDIRMSHVFTSTIVNNKAQQGGGIWYTEDLNANARFNSVAVWQNEASDQANVFGMVNPEQPTEDETLSEIFYPFSFSLIENVRASGSNNLESMPLNRQGVRFVNKTHDFGQSTVDQYDMAVENETAGENTFADFGYYGLTKYSVLCSTGMPNTYYNQLKESIAIADDDILGQPRIDTEEINNFIEIGARALPKRMPNKVLMLRLFVAHPDVVDTKTATQFMRLNEEDELDGAQKYYSQRGSSFAFPFNFLQDAIDYIIRARNGQIAGLKLMDGTEATSAIVRNLPFEIVLGKGIYYPKQSLTGSTESVWAQTFAIPEGVTIIGGFNPEGGVSESNPTYYGRYYKADKTKAASTTDGDIYTNVLVIEPNTTATPGGNEVGRGNKYGTETVNLPLVGTAASGGQPASSDYMPARKVTFQQWHIQDIADRRAMLDNNKNGIIEPWEFANQTIISGNAVNGETDGVYHIMTAVADEDAVGRLPKVQKQATSEEFTGYTKAIDGNPEDETGYQVMEEGQQIRLNGLIITGGNALTYLSTALDEYGKYIFYQGAGLQVDGNRYKNHKNNGLTGPAVFHNSAAYGIGYRDIPVSVTNCQFRNNVAGYGGAISTNGSLSIFDSSFEQNKAIAQTEEPEDDEKWYTKVSGVEQEVKKVMYPGQGGAILATGQLSAFNTLFANNEACLGEKETPTIGLVQHPTFRVPVETNASKTIRAAGGAIMMGSAANHHIVNCDFVRNKANAYPAVFTMNPTIAQTGATVDTHDYSQIINTVAWGNEVNVISSDANYLRASKLMVNIGKKTRDVGYISDKSNKNFYSPEFLSTNVPADTDLQSDNAEGGEWQEAAWFCAYEEGVGFKPNNALDLRDAIEYSPKKYAPAMIETAAKSIKGGSADLYTYYQNCNILIVAENGDVAGPNFGNPSVKAGYEGFTEGADWSPSRFNRLTDNGNGWIKQTVDPATLAVTFNNDDRVDKKLVPGENFQGAYPITHYISELTDDHQFPEYALWLALGREAYMRATNDMEPNDQYINGTNIGKRHKNYPRISADPTVGVQKAYIDIGVYEYQKQALILPGSEVDILWVSTKENPSEGPATGATWKTPTSDLQRAIKTLLQSRNGHKKEIRIMEGEYTPVTPQTVNGAKYNAFVIDTKSLNDQVITPSTFDTDGKNEKYYAQSITIKGGYSSEIPYAYDPVKYKTVIRQKEASSGVNTDHLIYIADPTMRYAYAEETAAGGEKTSGYKEANHFGAVVDGAADEQAQSVKTMPVQIDGVTLINDMADANKKGSAIYYPDYTGSGVPETNVTGAHTTSVGGVVVYYDSKTEMEKVDAMGNHKGEVVDHETEFAIVGGKVDYYETEEARDQVDSETKKHTGTTVAGPTKYAVVYSEGASTVTDRKLIITKTEIIGSGKKGDVIALDITNPTTEKAPSAVYVGQEGGAALIYNSVFHSNYGMPLDAWNTVNVNNTFGKNIGMVRLQNVADPTNGEGVVIKVYPKSQMHNTALWKNNETSKDVYGAQVLFGTATPALNTAIFTYNSFTGCSENGNGQESTSFNTALADDNSNIGKGPNFVDPENEDIELRNFDLKPSIRLLNKGNGYRVAAVEDDPATLENEAVAESYTGTYADKVVTNHYDFALASTTDKDALYRARIVSKEDNDGKQRIDIGAYEFQGNLIKVLYVDPNKSHDDAATGENWDKAFGYGDLQNAEDLAAIYHMSTPNEEAYVFVKGNSSTNPTLNTNETLTIRDGVTTYGSIISSYEDWHEIKDEHGHSKYTKIEDFIKDMTNQREGVASNAASKTIVTGIKTSEGEYDGTTNNTPALVDGFVVTDPNPSKTPVFDVTNPSEKAVIVVRNVVVADNKISDEAADNTNVAQISNGLIYEALFRDNKPKGNGAVLKVSNNPDAKYDNTKPTDTKTRGFAVNVTVEGKTVGADGTTPVDGVSANGEAGAQIFKSITNSINSGNGANAAGANAPYGAITNKGISGYFYNIADPNLNYQLTETSKYIDMCELDQVIDEGEYKGYPNFLPDNLKKFINYDTDRDLLGNPRYLARLTKTPKIDRGAFETWRVDNDFVCGKWTDSEHHEYGTNADREIGAQFYPHDGSVVYVMENKSLVIDPLHKGEEIKPTPENPGFLLVKKGANFYGNGRPVTAAYVAIEREVLENGAVVSVPYAMAYRSGVAKNTTSTEEGQHDLELTSDSPQEARYYNGGKRSEWDHVFQKTFNSNDADNCWAVIGDKDVTAASNGVFYRPSESHKAGLYRFTGKGTSLTDYIYREEGLTKAVTLVKYDDVESTNSGADYTDEKDMSWNCFGLPYLVSEYKPYEKVKATSDGKNVEAGTTTDNYSMYNPHTLWLYYDGVHTPDTKAEPEKTVDGDGGYYSVKAWKSELTDWHVSTAAEMAIWVGEGIFTQTATLDDTESLMFYLPVAPATFPIPTPSHGAKRYYVEISGIEDIEAEDVELIGTEFYTADGIRIEKPRRNTVVIIRKLYSNGTAKTSKQFVK